MNGLQERIDDTLEIPKGLSPKGRKAARIILDYIQEIQMTDTGGCKAFYTPDHWLKKLGNQYGWESELIVVYDGGDLGYLFDMDKAMEIQYAWMNEIDKRLREAGLYSEPCTCWHAAIYKER